jgi:hypothetical protein
MWSRAGVSRRSGSPTGRSLAQPQRIVRCTVVCLIYYELRVAWAGSAPSNTVVLVGGTEADVEDFDWPLRDGDLAALLERITAWQPRVIGVDISGPSQAARHRAARGGSSQAQGNCLDFQIAGWRETGDPASGGPARHGPRRPC